MYNYSLKYIRKIEDYQNKEFKHMHCVKEQNIKTKQTMSVQTDKRRKNTRNTRKIEQQRKRGDK
jgi:hypothetical protein